MITKIYSVRDKLVGFGGPIGFKEDKVALRWFESFCKQKKEQEFTEPKYYELYCIGEYDTETGEIKGKAKQELILVKEGEQFE